MKFSPCGQGAFLQGEEGGGDTLFTDQGVLLRKRFAARYDALKRGFKKKNSFLETRKDRGSQTALVYNGGDFYECICSTAVSLSKISTLFSHWSKILQCI